MRIGVDLKNNYKYGLGIAHHFTNVVRGLLDVDTRNDYVLLSPNDFRIRELEGPRAAVVSTPFPTRFGRVGYVFYDQVIFGRLARRQDLDVLLSPYFDLPILGRLPRLVAMVHDLVLVERADLYPRIFGTYYRACLRATLQRAAHILTLSEYSKQRLMEVTEVSPAQISVFPPSIDDRFRPADDRDLVRSRLHQLGVAEPYVLYTGGVDARKNLDTLIGAFARARAQLGKALTLACTGDVRRYEPLRDRFAFYGLDATAVRLVGR